MTSSAVNATHPSAGHAETQSAARKNDDVDAMRARAGGKAAGLLFLQMAHIDVPPFVAIDAALLEEWARSAQLDASASDDETARALLSRTPPPQGLLTALTEAQRILPPGPLAVRSSALDEDSTEHSHAGQFESVLYVEGTDALIEATARCLASSMSARARTYRKARTAVNSASDQPRRAQLGVVVQTMVEGDVSGVAFTVDPTSGSADRIVVSAALGLCEGVVQGSVNADTLSYSRTTGAWDADIAVKDEEVRRRAPHEPGTRRVPVSAERARRPALETEALGHLLTLLIQLDRAFGMPVDVEWTRSSGRFFVLQVRPATALLPTRSTPLPATGTDERVWDNANIVESFSGPTTAMTLSYIRFAYAIAYQQSCELGGVPPVEIKQNLRTFQSMLGVHDGRVYYNLASWYGLLSLFPRFEKNKEHMERMMGVRESARIMAQAPKRSRWQRSRMAFAWVRNLWRIDALVADFQERLTHTLTEWPASRFSTMSLTDLSNAYHVLVWRLLWHWQAPLVTDFAAMMSFGALSDLTKSWNVDASGSIVNDLLGGEGDVASLEPTRSLLRLADSIRADEALRALVEATPDAQCFDAVHASSTHAAFAAMLREHLERWGDRCIGELKLEEPSLAERPAFLFSMLKNYLRRADVNADSLERSERERRHAAESKVQAVLRSPIRRAVYFWLLAQARKHMKNRESMRFGRTRTFGLLRRLLLRMGELLVSSGHLAMRDDIFHLTIDEVMGFVEGTAVSTDLRGLSLVRKAEFERRVALPDPPDRFITHGAVGSAAREARQDTTLAGDGTLKGTPCSPGRVRAKVRIIHNPHVLLAALEGSGGGAESAWRLDGEILVAARTDPGWVPLYPAIRGLLVERGSPLSHSAIVAREMGLPAVVNIPALLDTLRDGMTVEMDGSTGVVTVLPP